MSRTARTIRSVVGLSLAAIVGLGLAWQTAKAEPSANDAEKAKLSPGAEAVKAAAKNHKYLFIYFWRDDTQQTREMRGVFQTALAKLADRADPFEIQVGSTAEKKLCGASRREPLADAVRSGHCPQRGDYERLRHSVRREAASRSVCEPLHGGVHEGPPGSEACAAVRRARLAASQASFAPAGRAGVQGRRGIREKQPGRVPGRWRCGGSRISQGPSRRSEDHRQSHGVDRPPPRSVGTFVGEVTKDQLVAKLKEAQSCCCPGGKCCPGGCCQH